MQAATAARQTAKVAYDLSKSKATTRATPEDININLRLFETSVIKVREDFNIYKGAQINYVVKAALGEDEHNTEMTAWGLVEEEHDVWFQGIEDKLDRLKTATAPPAAVVLTPVQKLAKAKHSLNLKKAELTGVVDSMKTRVEAITGKISKLQLQNHQAACEEITRRIEIEVKPINTEIMGMDMGEWEEHQKVHAEFVKGLSEKLEEVKFTIIAKTDEGATTASGARGGTDTSAYSQYKKNDLPLFNGNVREFPAFKREWQSLVAVGKTEEWQLNNLQKRTPEEIDLSTCVTVAEAWVRMEDKYASPTLVSHQIITEFHNWKPGAKSDASKLIELEHKLITMHRDLVAVGQGKQISENLFLLNATIKLIPSKFQDDLVKLRSEKEGVGGATMWTILKEFLEQKRKMFEKYSPWELDGKGEQEDTTKSCNFCKGKGHVIKDCPKKLARSTSAIGVKDDEMFKKKQAEYGPCPVCTLGHSFKPRSGGELASNRLYDCPTFVAMPPEERALKLETINGCAQCTSWLHTRDRCQLAARACGAREGGDQCALMHNRMLHGTRVKFVNLFQAAPASSKEIVKVNPCSAWPKMWEGLVLRSMVTYVWPNRVATTLFFDDGSTVSMITHKLAGFLGLVGHTCTEYIEVAGLNYQPIETKKYKLILKDNRGQVYKLNLMGMDRICSSTGKVNVDAAYRAFPHISKGALERGGHEVGLLIGQDNVCLLPTGGAGVNQVDNLRVMDCKFGSGHVLGGYHPEIYGVEAQLTEEAKNASVLRFAQCNRNGKIINTISNVKPLGFLEAEELGTVVPRRCNRCKGCPLCSTPSVEHSRKAEEEKIMLEKALVHDEENHTVTVSYPIIGDITRMKDNRYQAIAMEKSGEKKRKKLGQINPYNLVIRDFVHRDVLVKVFEQEIANWKAKQKEGGLDGYVHYIGHHGVEKEKSESTPLRLVANSALKNCSTGPSANDLWPKGPNSLNNLLEVMLRWRMYVLALVYDIKKAYQSVLTTPREKFLRLIVHREKEEDDWTTYGFNKMTFGDVPASVILELVKALAAEKYREIDPEAAKRIEEDTYVDDNLSGADSQGEIDRMVGNKFKVDGTIKYDGTVSQILGGVGLEPKVFVQTGEVDGEALEKMGPYVVGHRWNAFDDKLVFEFNVNLYEKKGGLRQGPDLTEKDLYVLWNFMFTRRKILSIINSFYDPMGVLAAYVIKFKIELRNVLRHEELEWDTPLPDKWQKKWRGMVEELVTAEPVVLSRAVKPVDAIGRPEIVAYWDGSEDAYATGIYVRWLVEIDGEHKRWEAKLLTGKARVCQLGGTTAPRSELNGFVILSRLMKHVVKSMREPPARVTMIGDAEATISAYESRTASLSPYFGNRIIEAEEKIELWGVKLEQEVMVELDLEILLDREGGTRVDLLFHTPGPLNPVDIATRGKATLDDVREGSIWQEGPNYLREDRATWPVTRDFRREVPAVERRNRYYQMVNATQTKLNKKLNKIEVSDGKDKSMKKAVELERLYEIMEYSNDWLKVRGIMARVLRMNADRPKPGFLDQMNSYKKPLTADDYEHADYVISVLAMRETAEMLVKNDLSGLAPFWEGCVWYTRGRLGRNTKRILGPDKLMILSPKTRLAELIMLQCHREDHRRDAGDTLFRSRKYAWVVRGRPVAERVVKKCGYCLKQRAVTLEQQMGDLPDEKWEIFCRPYTNICLDLAGPFVVVAMNNKRSTLKVWAVLFCCLNTGALTIKVTAGASTDDFLMQFEHHSADHGQPKYVYSDRGTNLTKSAQYVQKEDPENWAWDQVVETTARDGTRWEFAPPGCQWRDGLSEARVKALKRSLDHLMDGGPMNYAEFCCVTARAANIINDRPLGVRHHGGAEGELVPITPNLLLLQKTNSGDLGIDKYEDTPDKFTKRQKFVDDVLSVWWNMWYSQVFSSLVPFKKWKQVEKNVKPGDICMVKYEKKVTRADYRLCRVLEVTKDDKELVRTAKVGMRPRDKREKTLPYVYKDLQELDVGVQRLVMVCPGEELRSPADIIGINIY